jgi:hypothetical protein
MVAMKICQSSATDLEIKARRINQTVQQKAIFNSRIHIKG